MTYLSLNVEVPNQLLLLLHCTGGSLCLQVDVPVTFCHLVRYMHRRDDCSTSSELRTGDLGSLQSLD